MLCGHLPRPLFYAEEVTEKENGMRGGGVTPGNGEREGGKWERVKGSRGYKGEKRGNKTK